MFGFFKKPARNTNFGNKTFDKRTLRKNDISLLILDERWNSLFTSSDKSPEIISCEQKLKDLLKEQARLTTESKEIAISKKNCMDNIIKLTTEVFDKNNEQAKKEMHACEKEIKRINERIIQIESELDKIPELIRETNLELLEHTVNVVYFKIRTNQKKSRRTGKSDRRNKGKAKAAY